MSAHPSIPEAPRTAGPAPLPAVARPDVLSAFLAGRNPRTLAAYAKDLDGFARFVGAPSAAAACELLLSLAHGDANALPVGYRAHLADYDYDAYGDLLGGTPGILAPPKTAVLFAGEVFDPVLQQYQMRARIYDPATGRFTQRDGFAGDDESPLVYNKYAYALDDPANRVDPNGTEDLASLLATIATTGAIAWANAAAAYVRGRTVTSAEFRNIFQESVLINMYLDLNEAPLQPYLPYAEAYTNLELFLFDIQGKDKLENKIEDKVKILQYANTTHYDQVKGKARGLSPSANGFVDFAGPSTNLMNYGPPSTRKLLSGAARIINMVYLKSYKADFAEGDLRSGILLNRIWTNTTWHHHEILGIMVLAPQSKHEDLYHIGGVYFWKVMNGVTRKYSKNPARYDEEGRPR